MSDQPTMVEFALPTNMFGGGMVAVQYKDITALRARIAELEAERDRLRGLIDEHNNECVRRCGEGEQEGVRCGYRPYFPRRCPECPRHEMIEVAALDKNDIIDRARVAELKAALRQIAAYGDDGICPYGCDTPNIATKALAGKQPQEGELCGRTAKEHCGKPLPDPRDARIAELQRLLKELSDAIGRGHIAAEARVAELEELLRRTAARAVEGPQITSEKLTREDSP